MLHVQDKRVNTEHQAPTAVEDISGTLIWTEISLDMLVTSGTAQ